MALQNIFIHHVYFWLKNVDDEADLARLTTGVRTLTAIKTIREFHIGRPAETDRGVIDRSYSLSWMVLFNNAQDQASYQADPIHLKFVEECSSLWNRVIVYDSVDV